MPKKASDVEKALKKKGFTEDKSKSHNKYVLYIDGKKTNINTHTSQGASHKEISECMLNTMAKQMKITRKEFDSFVQCTLSEENYKKILYERNEINI